MLTQIKIANYKAYAYSGKATCTLDIKDLGFLRIYGRIIKDDLKDGEDYVTINANDGGAFSPDWEKSDLKILYVLRESYILKKSFFEEGDRGGHRQNEEYATNYDLWENVTYRNLVKMTWFAYCSMMNIPLGKVDFRKDDVWDQACDVFRKHAAVICANPFPGLAFNSTKTDLGLLKQWLAIPEVQNLLKEKIQVLNPKLIYAAFDLGLVSSYPHLFGWLKERTLDELVEYEGEQTILSDKVLSGGSVNAISYVTDNTGLCWLQGKHPARFSHSRMAAFASAIYEAIRSKS